MKHDLSTAEVPKEIVKHHIIVMPKKQWVLIICIQLMYVLILALREINFYHFKCCTYIGHEFYRSQTNLGAIENTFHQK